MKLICKTCGSNKIYLKKRGMQVGAYCSTCDKWIKWVSKKDLTSYTNMGYKIHNEDYIEGLGNTIGVQVGNFHGSADSWQNRSVGYEDMVEPDYYDDYTGGYTQNQKVLVSNNLDDINIEAGCCEICDTGIISQIDQKSSKVVIKIVDNVLTILDRGTLEILGTARIDRCPKCGRKL